MCYCPVLAKGTFQVAAEGSCRKDERPWMESVQWLFFYGVNRNGGNPPIIKGIQFAVNVLPRPACSNPFCPTRRSCLLLSSLCTNAQPCQQAAVLQSLLFRIARKASRPPVGGGQCPMVRAFFLARPLFDRPVNQ